MVDSMLDDVALGADQGLACDLEPSDVLSYSAPGATAGRRRETAATQGELRYGQARLPVAGRALHLIAWLAAHQERINQCGAESGQLWLTWKGDGPHSISGDIRTRL